MVCVHVRCPMIWANHFPKLPKMRLILVDEWSISGIVAPKVTPTKSGISKAGVAIALKSLDAMYCAAKIPAPVTANEV